jgi:hypothetical protein
VAAKKKNSLVANINARKKAGKSRPKSRSTVSSYAYSQMEHGWPKKAAKTRAKRAKKKSRVSQTPDAQLPVGVAEQSQNEAQNHSSANVGSRNDLQRHGSERMRRNLASLSP